DARDKIVQGDLHTADLVLQKIVEHVEVDCDVDIKNNCADFNDDTIVVHENTRAENQTRSEGANNDSEEDITIIVELVRCKNMSQRLDWS
ncbi:hypothetical protein A2U01_0060238, partial [Trifolium medium]|nr:hypothetical protein [Trifolium medium]